MMKDEGLWVGLVFCFAFQIRATGLGLGGAVVRRWGRLDDFWHSWELGEMLV